MLVRPYDLDFVVALLDSHAALLGGSLAPPELSPRDAADWLYGEAGFAVLAHDTQADPCFVFANLAAQRVFEREWSELVGIPSRLSAQPGERAERAALLDAVQRDGYSRDYRGLRVAKSGRRFWIEQTVLWNVRDAAGALVGQAAMFASTRPA
ncbi:MAG: MEKHLA domain-containing protein [Polyangiales bacterium]